MRGLRAVVPRTTDRDRGRSATAALLVALLVLTGALGGCDPARPDRPDPGSPTGGPAGDPATGVRVRGNQLVDAAGRTVRLRGFNHAGAEYACVDGDGLFDTPDGAAPGDAVVAAMKSWSGANAVRVPLNEQCWLGLPSVSARYAGAAYRSAIDTFVDRLQAHGMVAILDLHRSAPADGVSKEQEQLPDRDHSLDFWTGVATAFGNRAAVVFDLFNEPYPFAETDSDRAWACWRDGGCRLTSVNTGRPYVAAGMTELIAAVRATGARNVVLAGGIHWAESLTRWLVHRPADPLGQLAAAFHAYSFNDYCVDVACYDRDLAPIAAAVPLIVGEIGPALNRGADGIDEDCPSTAVQPGGTFADTMLDWADAHGSGYTPWSWNPWGDCWSLVTDWAGTPSPLWGAQVRQRLARSG
jgi:hypothetical protein